MAKKDQRTKAELLAALNQADRAADARVEAIKEDMRSLRDGKMRIEDELQNARTALAELERQNNQLRGQVVAMETEYLRQLHLRREESEIERTQMEGRLDGQREAFLATIELLLARTAGGTGIDFREFI